MCVCRPQISKCYRYFFFKCWLTSNMQCNIFKLRANERSLQLAERQRQSQSQWAMFAQCVFSSFFLLSLALALLLFVPNGIFPTHTHFFIVFASEKKIIANKNIFAIIEWAKRQMNVVWLGSYSELWWYLQVSSQHAMSTNLNQFHSSIFNWIYGIRFGHHHIVRVQF